MFEVIAQINQKGYPSVPCLLLWEASSHTLHQTIKQKNKLIRVKHRWMIKIDVNLWVIIRTVIGAYSKSKMVPALN